MLGRQSAREFPGRGSFPRGTHWTAGEDGHHLHAALGSQRFQVASGKSPYPMIALYEVEADEPQDIWKLTEHLAAGMIHTEALDEAAAFILQPIGLRVEAVSE